MLSDFDQPRATVPLRPVLALPIVAHRLGLVVLPCLCLSSNGDRLLGDRERVRSPDKRSPLLARCSLSLGLGGHLPPPDDEDEDDEDALGPAGPPWPCRAGVGSAFKLFDPPRPRAEVLPPSSPNSPFTLIVDMLTLFRSTPLTSMSSDAFMFRSTPLTSMFIYPGVGLAGKLLLKNSVRSVRRVKIQIVLRYRLLPLLQLSLTTSIASSRLFSAH